MIRVKELREQRKMQQKELAIDLHVSQPTISDWESGRKVPSARSTQLLADYFGVTVDYLLGRSDEPYMHKVPLEPSLRGVTDPAERQRLIAALAALHPEDYAQNKKEPVPDGDELSDPLDVQLMNLLRRLTPDQKKWLLARIDTLLELQ